MPLGYLGYLKVADTFVLCNTAGLNRVVAPIMSKAVWGAGWYNAASVTNYADSQMHFEGGVNFELQGEPVVWNLVRDWLIEQRAFPQSVLLSPNGQVVHSYLVEGGDSRTGVWLRDAAFRIDATSLVTVGANGIALIRTETVSGSAYKDGLRANVGIPTKPLNPTTRNRNPIPGWNVQAEVTWPGAPAFWNEPNALNGMVLQNADVTVNNNTQIIRGCTGDPSPVAVLQGTIEVTGSMSLWRDGGIPDPFGEEGTFTSDDASVIFNLGGTPALTMRIPNLLIVSDAYEIQEQNTPVPRTFGLAGLGDGVNPPFMMDQA
jgi:hypothetical protein